jgi:hypothetical protein
MTIFKSNFVAGDPQHVETHNAIGAKLNQGRYVDARDFPIGVGGDVTAALQGAIDESVSAKMSCYFPAGRFQFSHLSFSNGVSLVGEVGHIFTADVFGGSQWNTSNETGTVLECTATSGAALALETTYDAVHLEGIVVKGIGDNTRTTIGIDVGSGGVPQSSLFWRNVRACNFLSGIRLREVYSSLFEQMVIRGCHHGLESTENLNQNTFMQISASSCDVALHLVSASVNTFVGASLQGTTDTAIYMNGCEENQFHGFYLENLNANYAIHLLAGDGNIWTGLHGGAAGDNILIESSNNRLQCTKYFIGSITLGVTSQDNNLDVPAHVTIIDNGTNYRPAHELIA